MTRCFGVVPIATSSSLICPNSCVALTSFSVFAAISLKSRAAGFFSVMTGLSLRVRLGVRPYDSVACFGTRRASAPLLRVHLMAESANLPSQFGKLASHFVEILSTWHTKHRRSGFGDIVLPAAKLQSGLQQFFLSMQKAFAALISDQFLVGDFTPLRKSFPPVWRRIASAGRCRRHRFEEPLRGLRPGRCCYGIIARKFLAHFHPCAENQRHFAIDVPNVGKSRALCHFLDGL